MASEDEKARAGKKFHASNLSHTGFVECNTLVLLSVHSLSNELVVILYPDREILSVVVVHLICRPEAPGTLMTSRHNSTLVFSFTACPLPFFANLAFSLSSCPVSKPQARLRPFLDSVPAPFLSPKHQRASHPGSRVIASTAADTLNSRASFAARAPSPAFVTRRAAARPLGGEGRLGKQPPPPCTSR